MLAMLHRALSLIEMFLHCENYLDPQGYTVQYDHTCYVELSAKQQACFTVQDKTSGVGSRYDVLRAHADECVQHSKASAGLGNHLVYQEKNHGGRATQRGLWLLSLVVPSVAASTVHASHVVW